MTTVIYKYGTGNPIGSEDVKDGIDNLKSFDTFMNDDGDSYNQRDGEVVKTLAGAVKGVGVERVGDFTAGCTVTQRNQGVQEIFGSVYVWLGAIPLGGKIVPPNSSPYTTGGVGPSGWLDVGDASLRHDLSQTTGASLVGTSSGETVEVALSSRPSAAVNAHNNDSFAHPQLSAFITSEADRAEAAADAASLSGDVYPDTASGLAATTSGQYFSVVSPAAEGYLDLYRNNSGVAAFQKTYPSSALVKRLDNGFNKLTGDNGFSVDGSDGQSFIEIKKGDTKALIIGTYDDEMMTFDTASKKVIHKSSELVAAAVTKSVTMSDVDEPDSEHTESLISSTHAKVIGDAKHALTFDTVNGELISTFKIVDNSQNNWGVLNSDMPVIVTGIPPEYAFANRKFQAIPTMARTGSRYWVSWWADVNVAGEAPGNFFVIGYSDDNCQTVTESHVLRYNNMDHQLTDPMLWTNPETGELWFFWSTSSNGRAVDGVQGCWCSVLENPEAQQGFSWSLPYRYRNVGGPRRPVRVAGKWMQCIDMYTAQVNSFPLYPETMGCTFVEFDPRTKTTTTIGRNTPNYLGLYRGYFETEVVQLMDGRLMSTTRPNLGTDNMTRTFSEDGGKTWSEHEVYTALGDTTSTRSWLGRTPSGRLMIVYNNSKSRQMMTIKLSEDDGETWPYSAILVGEGSPENTSYPIAAFDGDDIYVVYDYGRITVNEIRISFAKESEIINGTYTQVAYIVSGPTTP